MMLEVSLAASWSTALLVLLACSALRWLYQRWQQQKALARAVSLGVASTPQTKPPVLEAPRAPASSICPGGVCKVPKQRTTEDLVTSALALLQSQKQRTVIPPSFPLRSACSCSWPFLKGGLDCSGLVPSCARAVPTVCPRAVRVLFAGAVCTGHVRRSHPTPTENVWPLVTRKAALPPQRGER
jgi:hypothetical protein